MYDLWICSSKHPRAERTKEGLRARVAKGIKLGKPKGTIQASMYDKDKDQILHLYHLGVPIQKIITTHLKYGKYLSLKVYINKVKINDDNILKQVCEASI